MLQACVSCPEPWQLAPPLDGAGLLQDLVLPCCPPIQLAEHVDQAPHWPQPPSVKHLHRFKGST